MISADKDPETHREARCESAKHMSPRVSQEQGVGKWAVVQGFS